jgi:16S rRNA (cytidine1402-2'-O)-methyltransferase
MARRSVGLVFVPTPIGNLRDITLRALDTLRACELVVAEDTRTLRRLLNALDLPSKPALSYREQNAEAATGPILERAREALVAVVTDAGMPGISDPGRELILAARAAGIGVEVLPGPSAFVCAAVLSGFPLTGFSFEGFVPRREAERRRVLGEALLRPTASVWYEAPTRIGATLATLERLAPLTDIFVARELSKHFEQQLFGPPGVVRAALPAPIRGEIVLVLGPAAAREGPAPPPASASDLRAAIEAELASGATVADAAKRLVRRFGVERAAIYRAIVAQKNDGRP